MSEPKKTLESAGNLKRFKEKAPRRGRVLLLLLTIAALGFALFLAIRPSLQQDAVDPDASVVLIERDKTLLDTIAVKLSGSEAYTLINLNDYDLSDKNDVIGKEYAVKGDPDFSVSTAQVLPMEHYASDLTAEDMAARSPGDLDEYGLKQPDLTVIIGYRDGAKETLHFGGAVPTGSGRYLQLDGDPAVYIVAESVYEAFHQQLSDLKQTEQEKAELEAAQATRATTLPEATTEPNASIGPDAAPGQGSAAAPDASTPSAAHSAQPFADPSGEG